MEAGIESTQALSKQSGFSVPNQFEQWLKPVGRGALKACTHPLLSPSQSPRADAVFTQRLSSQNGRPISWVGRGTEKAEERGGACVRRGAGRPACRESVDCRSLTERGWGSITQ